MTYVYLVCVGVPGRTCIILCINYVFICLLCYIIGNTQHYMGLHLCYRVWRENRDRIVGWYDRFAYWNPRKRLWYYSWDVSCEPSLALTGAAFYHKVIVGNLSFIVYTMFAILCQDNVSI